MGKGGKIDVYFDCNSPWSYFAYTFLRRNRAALQEHEIDIEVHPIFLGGVNVGSGNKPPWTLPAKAKYGAYDGPRGQKYFRTPKLTAPSFFPILSLLPMRCLLYAKDHYAYPKYEDAFGSTWEMYWIEHKDISKPEFMLELLKRHFTGAEAEDILRGGTSAEYKKKLTDEVGMLVEKGAFGAPWFRVTNREGVEEPFFGSDRFHFMFQFLGVPFQDIAILPPESGSSKL